MLTSSLSNTAFSIRADTPQARTVRSIDRRCSKARPTAELTMNSPTRNDSSPKAVRLRWKLSVSRCRSVSASGSTNRNRSPATASSGGRAPLVLPIASREIRFGMCSSRCATPISTINTLGASCRCILSGGRAPAPAISGVAPSGSARSASVSGATSVWPGGSRKACTPARPISGVAVVSAGSVTGSMPSRRTERPPMVTRPSSIGDTGQPARRKSTNSCCGEVARSRPTSIAVRAPPKVAAARS